MYNWIVYLHLLGIFGFLLAHGASASAAFALRRERNLDKVRALLELSAGSIGVMYLSLLVLLASGIIAAFMGNWWGRGWIWVSLALLIVILVAMGAMGSRYYGEARKLAGLPYFAGRKVQPPLPAASPDEVFAVLARANPVLLTVIGLGGFAIITWLMRFKPF
jgi:hypothetical protein